MYKKRGLVQWNRSSSYSDYEKTHVQKEGTVLIQIPTMKKLMYKKRELVRWNRSSSDSDYEKTHVQKEGTVVAHILTMKKFMYKKRRLVQWNRSSSDFEYEKAHVQKERTCSMNSFCRIQIKTSERRKRKNLFNDIVLAQILTMKKIMYKKRRLVQWNRSSSDSDYEKTHVQKERTCSMNSFCRV